MHLINRGSDGVAGEFYSLSVVEYEPSTIPFFRRLVACCRIFFDIGAYHGLFALMAAIEHPETTAYALEPVREPFAALKANLGANRLENVHPICAAVTDFDGEITLFVPPVWQNTSASTRKGFRANCREFLVEAVTLDTLVARHAVEK
jgi:FkbM family methyltransferase